MPNNTFIKLFHFLNADADEGGVAIANPGETEEENIKRDAFKENAGY